MTETVVGVLDGPVSVALVFVNAALYALFLGFYLVREPWRRSWVGWTIVLFTVAVLQISIRAVLTEFLGEDYPGRDLVLLVGRLELLISGLVVFVGLLRMRRRG